MQQREDISTFGAILFLCMFNLVYEEYEDGANINEVFSSFIDILNLDQEFVQGIRLFVERMRLQPEIEDIDEIVHNFMELITFRHVHPSEKPHQSATAVFVAFSQIDQLGNWGPVSSVSSIISPMIYARRSIVLSAIHRRGNESDFNNVENLHCV